MNNSNINKTFNLSYTDPNTGETVEGMFTCKRLSVMDRARIGARKSQLGGGSYCVRDDNGNPTGVGLDEETEYLNAMLAHLEVSLVQAPAWFKLNEVYDLGLLTKVYTEVVGHEASFFRPKNGQADSGNGAGSAATGGAQPSGEVSGNSPKKVVGGQVSATLDP